MDVVTDNFKVVIIPVIIVLVLGMPIMLVCIDSVYRNIINYNGKNINTVGANKNDPEVEEGNDNPVQSQKCGQGIGDTRKIYISGVLDIVIRIQEPADKNEIDENHS